MERMTFAGTGGRSVRGRTRGGAARTALQAPELAARAGPPCVCVPGQAARRGPQRRVGKTPHCVFKVSTGKWQGRRHNLGGGGT